MESFHDEEIEAKMEERRAQLDCVKEKKINRSRRSTMTANISSLQYIQLVPLCGRKTLPTRNVLEGSWRASGLAHIGSLTPLVEVTRCQEPHQGGQPSSLCPLKNLFTAFK